MPDRYAHPVLDAHTPKLQTPSNIIASDHESENMGSVSKVDNHDSYGPESALFMIGKTLPSHEHLVLQWFMGKKSFIPS